MSANCTDGSSLGEGSRVGSSPGQQASGQGPLSLPVWAHHSLEKDHAHMYPGPPGTGSG